MSNIRKALENENVSEDMIKKVLKELGIKESKRWKPKIGEMYWTVSRRNRVMFYKWEGDPIDRIELSMGNAFKTKQEAEHHRDKINFLAQMKNDFEDNSDLVDWDDGGQKKYYIYAFRQNDELKIGADYYYQASGTLYTTSGEWLEQYISENETEIKKYLFGIE